MRGHKRDSGRTVRLLAAGIGLALFVGGCGSDEGGSLGLGEGIRIFSEAEPGSGALDSGEAGNASRGSGTTGSGSRDSGTEAENASRDSGTQEADRSREMQESSGETEPGQGEPGQSAAPQETNYAGSYVDTQGTTDVYSELILVAREDGKYDATIGLYRLTTFEGEAMPENEAMSEGEAAPEGEKLLFEDANGRVRGEIVIGDTGAQFKVLESDFAYISAGDVFDFPEKQ